MILAMAVVLLSTSGAPAPSTAPKVALAAPVASKAVSGDTKASPSSSPAPLPAKASDGQPSKSTESKATIATTTESVIKPVSVPALNLYLPPPPTFRPETEPIRRPSRSWFVLMAAEHSAAGFDAWSTRNAVSQGRVEADPLVRPFSHSGAIYGAIQVVPFGLDYAARRMQRSSGWTRHVWWLPQSLATASFLFSGTYNFSHSR